MKNHSHLLNTFKLALVCGATLLPFSEAHAGWNKMVEALTDVTPEAIAPLKVLRDRKLEESPNNMKWVKRSRQLAILETTPAKSLDGLKKHLMDRRLVDKTRNDKIEHKADGFVKAIQEVADSPERAKPGFVELARRAAEYKAGSVAVKQERTETPASTLVKHSQINVQAQIACLEAFNAEMAQLGDLDADIKRTISTNKAQLPQLRKLAELGVTEYADGASLAELISQHEEKPVSANNSNNDQEAPSLPPAYDEQGIIEIMNADGSVSIEGFIRRAKYDIANTPQFRERAQEVLQEMLEYRSLGIVSFKDAADLEAQIARGEANNANASDVANSSPAHVPVSATSQVDEEIAMLEMALATAENDRERSIYRAQLAKVKPQPVKEVANSNLPTPQPPAPKPVAFNVEEEIQLCNAVINSDASAREKGIYKGKLAKLEAAKKVGVETYGSEDELLQYMPVVASKVEAIVSAPSVVSSVQAAQISVPAQIESINAIIPTLGVEERGNYNTLLQMHTAAFEYGIESYANHADLERQLREHGYRGDIVQPDDNAGVANNNAN